VKKNLKFQQNLKRHQQQSLKRHRQQSLKRNLQRLKRVSI
jgi:hypothetical protein